MPISLPPEIKKLMNNKVTWESFQGFDGHGEPRYAAPRSLRCRQEATGISTGGMSAIRRPDGTTVEPKWRLFFHGDDPNARKIQLYDRFTTSAVGQDSAQKLQAVQVNTVYGPDFDNRNPWLVEVTL